MKIAILGGTGNEGKGLGFRWAAAGHEILIGSRVQERAEDAATELNDRLPAGVPPVTGAENLAVTHLGDVIVLAVPYEAQQPTLAAVKEALAGKLLVSVVAPLKQPKGRLWTPPGGSAALEAQAQLGDAARIIAAFQCISAEHLKELDNDIDSDVLVCGDKKADREVAVTLAAAAGMRGVHAGPLQNTPVVEGLASVMIAINVRYKIKDAGLRVTGLPG